MKTDNVIALVGLLFAISTYFFTKVWVAAISIAACSALFWFAVVSKQTKSTFRDVRKTAKILFIDDKECQIVKTMKRNGFDVRKVNDVQSPTTDADVEWSNIIFVDYKGIGKKLFGKKEGLGLISELKRIYGNEKRYIIYSSVQDFDGLTDFPYIRKNASYDEFVSYIEQEFQKL